MASRNGNAVQFTLTGRMPLLMHADDVESADLLESWRKDPSNKNSSRAGDDRSPSWTWQTYCYSDGTHLAMPAENVMVALRQAGTQMILKKQKTFKEITQSGLLIATEYCEFFSNGKQVPVSAVDGLREKTFSEQRAGAKKLGFDLFIKRARVGTSKHIRVRPRFDKWEVRGMMHILKPELTFEVVQQLFDLAGSVGICDWRPGCKTPGPYGMFSSKVTAA